MLRTPPRRVEVEGFGVALQVCSTAQALQEWNLRSLSLAIDVEIGGGSDADSCQRDSGHSKL